MDNNSIVKQMPMSIEAEQALLGSLIINPESFDKVAGYISAGDFYLDEHKHIYSALIKMYNQSKVIDAVTLVNTLVEEGDRDEAGGIQYISLIAESVPAVSNIKDYARIVKDKSTLRKLIAICDDISVDAYDEGAPVKTIVDSAEQKIFDISHNNESRDFRHIREILQNVYQDIEVLAENNGAVTGSKTGFSGLDRMLIQMGKGDLVIVGARPGMGKTSFAMNIAVNVAKQKKAVAIFSLEMSGEQLVTRILSSEALVDSSKLRTGQLKTEDWDNIAGVISSLSGCEIYIDDTSAITTAEMKSKLRRIKNLGLVVIDYIGLMQSTSNSDNRAQQVGEISRNLKIMAKDLGVPIVCCAQLNRGTESRTGDAKKPTLADLRDSGSIEQDADIVLFLYRDEYYKDISGNDNQGAEDSANTAEVIIAKNRHGSVGNVKMGWIGQFTKFRTLEKDINP
ncbi:MAG: replicative DNA helicase [Oscillospiraceae bacterium]|nr:replicative DNA helicase [Oscillospiraceae bacterium]